MISLTVLKMSKSLKSLKSCNNCGASTYYKLCTPCYENTWPFYKCSRCKESFRRNPNARFKTRESRCSKCIKNNKNCKFCKKMFSPLSEEDHCSLCTYSQFRECLECKAEFVRNRYSQEDYCKGCSVKRDKILKSNLNDPDTLKFLSENCKPGFVIQITYYVESEDHDGWCSDPYEITKDNHEEIKEYPLIKGFKNEHIDRDTGIVNLNGYQWPLSYYNIPSHCHGYCGCETEYFIKRAKVIETKKRIDLDECPSDSDEGDR